jgi:hypothetical protein
MIMLLGMKVVIPYEFIRRLERGERSWEKWVCRLVVMGESIVEMNKAIRERFLMLFKHDYPCTFQSVHTTLQMLRKGFLVFPFDVSYRDKLNVGTSSVKRSAYSSVPLRAVRSDSYSVTSGDIFKVQSQGGA